MPTRGPGRYTSRIENSKFGLYFCISSAYAYRVSIGWHRFLNAVPGGACDGCKRLGPPCCEGAVNRNVALDSSNSGYSGAESLAQLVASV